MIGRGANGLRTRSGCARIDLALTSLPNLAPLLLPFGMVGTWDLPMWKRHLEIWCPLESERARINGPRLFTDLCPIWVSWDLRRLERMGDLLEEAYGSPLTFEAFEELVRDHILVGSRFMLTWLRWLMYLASSLHRHSHGSSHSESLA